jgi:two-component system sensor histidine kinase MtrB
VLGIVTTAILLLGAAGVVVWLRSRASRPVFRIGEAMERFGAGDATTGAPETGQEELRSIAQRFNEMSSAINCLQEKRLAFVAGMAHDLRNPLSALRMSTGVIPPDRPLPSEERARRTLGVVERQIAHLDRLVSDLPAAASIEAGQLKLRFETRDVYDVHQSASRLHQLELSLPGAPVIAPWDPGRISQVLNNRGAPGAAGGRRWIVTLRVRRRCGAPPPRSRRAPPSFSRTPRACRRAARPAAL